MYDACNCSNRNQFGPKIGGAVQSTLRFMHATVKCVRIRCVRILMLIGRFQLKFELYLIWCPSEMHKECVHAMMLRKSNESIDTLHYRKEIMRGPMDIRSIGASLIRYNISNLTPQINKYYKWRFRKRILYWKILSFQIKVQQSTKQLGRLV